MRALAAALFILVVPAAFAQTPAAPAADNPFFQEWNTGGFSIAFSPDGRWLAVPVSVSRGASTSLVPQMDHKILYWKTEDLKALVSK